MQKMDKQVDKPVYKCKKIKQQQLKRSALWAIAKHFSIKYLIRLYKS